MSLVAGRVRTAKYLLQPTAGQRVRLDHLVWQQRKLYNRALEERRKAWQEEGRSLSRYEQFAGLSPATPASRGAGASTASPIPTPRAGG